MRDSARSSGPVALEAGFKVQMWVSEATDEAAAMRVSKGFESTIAMRMSRM